MFRLIVALSFLAFSVLLADGSQSSLQRLENRISNLEKAQGNLDREAIRNTRKLNQSLDDLKNNKVAGFTVFFSGILCALWAQYTHRSAWLWFFFGAIFAPIALIAMVWKNARGLASGELKFWTRE